jgi:hypothetical protein
MCFGSPVARLKLPVANHAEKEVMITGAIPAAYPCAAMESTISCRAFYFARAPLQRAALHPYTNISHTKMDPFFEHIHISSARPSHATHTFPCNAHTVRFANGHNNLMVMYFCLSSY